MYLNLKQEMYLKSAQNVKLKLASLISLRALIDSGAYANVFSENQCAKLRKDTNVNRQK